MNAIQDYISKKGEYSGPFMERVTEKVARDYRDHIPGEMFLTLISERVVNYLPVGAAVLILHDVTDLGASNIKLVVDITPMTYQIGGYIVMVVSWVYFRLWYFPVFIIYRIYEESQEWHGKTCNANLICMLITTRRRGG